MSTVEIRETETERAFNASGLMIRRAHAKPGILCPECREGISQQGWESFGGIWSAARREKLGCVYVVCSAKECESVVIFVSKNAKYDSSGKAVYELPMRLGFGHVPFGSLYYVERPAAWEVREPTRKEAEVKGKRGAD